MNFPKMAFKIEDRVYRLDATDGPAIKKIPEEDREHLITLLGAIQKQHNAIKSPEQNTIVPDSILKKEAHLSVDGSADGAVVGSVNINKGSLQSKLNEAQSQQNSPSEKKADVDQMMTRLIAQERRNSKPFNKQKMYLVMGGITIGFLLFLLLLI